MVHEIEKRTYKEEPFLSIVTRCLKDKRPVSFEVHESSIDNQTDKDIEHIYVVDPIGLGLHAANKSLALAAPHVTGKYVHILDDDDYYTTMRFVETMKKLARIQDPDIIIFRGFIDLNSPNGKIYPTDKIWGKGIKAAHIGSFNFILKAELWKQYIHHFGLPNMGDFNMLNELFKRKHTVGLVDHWHDAKMVATYQVGRGGKRNR